MSRQLPTRTYYQPAKLASQYPSSRQSARRRRTTLRRALVLLASLIIVGALIAIWKDSNGVRSAFGGNHFSPKKVLSAAETASQEEKIQKSNTALQSIFQNWINGHPDQEWALYVEDLKDERRKASLNGDSRMAIASLYKLFLLQPLARQLPSEEWSTAQIAGRSYSQCVTAMLQVSDNACAESIGRQIGWRSLDSQIHAAGYLQTELNRNVVQGTANDTAMIFKKLYKGQGFDDTVRKIALPALRLQKHNQGIPKACANCTVLNKTGDFVGYLNDAGVVEAEGKAYLLVVLSKGGTYALIAELATQVHQEMIKEL